ncbi:MAG: polyprenyl synthetase family protein, partial [Desulfonatronovibrio sp.]
MAAMVDDRLKTCFKDLDIPEQLAEAMNYSLLAGGKRVRPVLCLSWAGMLGLRCGRALDFAVAVEL